jgi:AraC-like DNA-binding protein
VIGGQGSKYCYLEGKRFNYSAGNLLTLFLSMPLIVEITEASSDEPHLAVAIELDLSRLTNILMKIDSVEPIPVKPATIDTSGIFSAPLKESLLDVAIRLFKIIDKPSEVAVLGDAIVDEIYFRVLSDERGGTLKYLLQQRGQVHQVSRAVEYIHSNIDKQVSIDELAGLVNMSSSGFHRKFKDVMHLSPLQYAKSIKLHKAQTFIQEGKKANEAGYLVGYNSPAQFSREYKRHFGFAPSET